MSHNFKFKLLPNSASTETQELDNFSQDKILLSKTFVVEKNSLENSLQTSFTHK